MLNFAPRQRLSPARSDFDKKLKIYPGQNAGGIVKICYKKVVFPASRLEKWPEPGKLL